MRVTDFTNHLALNNPNHNFIGLGTKTVVYREDLIDKLMDNCRIKTIYYLTESELVLSIQADIDKPYVWVRFSFNPNSTKLMDVDTIPNIRYWKEYQKTLNVKKSI